VITGFVAGDTIDITDLSPGSVTSTMFDTGTGELTLDYNTSDVAGGTLNLTLSGNYTAADFASNADAILQSSTVAARRRRRF